MQKTKDQGGSVVLNYSSWPNQSGNPTRNKQVRNHPAAASRSSTDLGCVLDYNLQWIRPWFVAHITE